MYEVANLSDRYIAEKFITKAYDKFPEGNKVTR